MTSQPPLAPAEAPRPLRIALLEHPREASWFHMNDIANTPLSSSLMTGYAAAVLEAQGHQVSVRGRFTLNRAKSRSEKR